MQNLPPELIVEIFSYLYPSELENASLVCMKWKEIIVSSHAICDRLVLRISKNFQSHLTLPYKRCEIFSIKDDRNKRCSFTFSPPLLEIFEGLTDLTFEDCFINLTTTPAIIRMPHLRQLRVDQESWKIISVIQGHKITHFAFTALGGVCCDDKLFKRILRKFFLNARDLKHLMFSGVDLLNLKLYDCSFRLKSLELRSYFSHRPLSFRYFLMAQRESLEELIYEKRDMDIYVLNFIYFFMNLKKLLDCHWERCFLIDEVNTSIHTLSISNLMSYKMDFRNLEAVMIKCQALELVHIEMQFSPPNQIAKLLSRVLPRIKAVISLNFYGVKKMKKILRLIRLNGFHYGFGLRSLWWRFNMLSLFDDPSKIHSAYQFTLLITASTENFRNLRHVGKINEVNSIFQLTSNSKYDSKFNLINLSKFPQQKRQKKLSQFRILIENAVILDEKNEDSQWHMRHYFNFDDIDYWDEYGMLIYPDD